jgi:hypothetical protein
MERAKPSAATAHSDALACAGALKWPVPTRTERAASIHGALQSQLGAGFCRPLVQLIAEFAGPGRLLYMVRNIPTVPGPNFWDVACYDETALDATCEPLWRLSLETHTNLYPANNFYVANSRSLFVIDTYTELFATLDVATRTWRSLPPPVPTQTLLQGVAADDDFVWAYGSQRNLLSFDLCYGQEWRPDQSCLLPPADLGHSFTALGRDYHRWPDTSLGDMYPAAIVLGGRLRSNGPQRATLTACCHLMLWSKTRRAARWLRLPDLLRPRSGHRAIVLNGRAVVVGGFDGTDADVAHDFTLESLDLRMAITFALAPLADHSVAGDLTAAARAAGEATWMRLPSLQANSGDRLVGAVTSDDGQLMLALTPYNACDKTSARLASLAPVAPHNSTGSETDAAARWTDRALAPGSSFEYKAILSVPIS